MGPTGLRVTLLFVLSAWLGGCAYPDGERPQARESEARRALRQYEEQMAQLGGPPPRERSGNVIVVLERYTYDRSDFVRVASAWRYADEHILAGSRAGRLWTRNGVRLGLATDRFRSALGISATGRRQTTGQRMMLTPLSGQEASLMVGSEVYLPALRIWTWAGPVVLFEREFVGSSLVVVPEVVGADRVRLALFPRFTSRSGRTIDVTELRTEVVVPHGQTLVVGGLDESQDGLAYALFALGRRRGDRRTLLLVTPYIEAARPDHPEAGEK